ncbi:hypothetical protein TetV_064 [Tetraselmis virus 1]|uniref:Uncharacterized protein n=1 Tax=Tetraselmis virus 1 TaxID=2060617 RepID=A0A2P0VMP3_9VIRU|nr:hypothetical protein QJ968_gp064 [Tetraselmis virus 1]AUF82156.1 hypothetical protein TetV_064 [Tetraselmis virus 1]
MNNVEYDRYVRMILNLVDTFFSPISKNMKDIANEIHSNGNNANLKLLLNENSWCMAQISDLLDNYNHKFLPKFVDLETYDAMYRYVELNDVLSYNLQPRVFSFSVPTNRNWEALRQPNNYLAVFKVKSTNILCKIHCYSDSISVVPCNTIYTELLYSTKRYKWLGFNFRIVKSSGVKTYIMAFSDSNVSSPPDPIEDNITSHVNTALTLGWTSKEVESFITSHEELPVVIY